MVREQMWGKGRGRTGKLGVGGLYVFEGGSSGTDLAKSQMQFFILCCTNLHETNDEKLRSTNWVPPSLLTPVGPDLPLLPFFMEEAYVFKGLSPSGARQSLTLIPAAVKLPP